jgi:hypothetical protein
METDLNLDHQVSYFRYTVAVSLELESFYYRGHPWDS